MTKLSVHEADLGIIFALPHESGCFVDMLSEVNVHRGHGFTVRRGRYRDRDVVVVESGPGLQRAAKAAHALIDAYRPRLAVSAGFAGGLNARLRRHELIAADSLVDSKGGEISLDPASHAPWLSEITDLHCGRLLTFNRIVRLTEEKKQLGAEHQALAVDMESFAVAEACRERAIDLLVIRAISDAVDDELPPDIGRLLAQQSFAGQLGAAVGSIFRRPAAVKDLFNLHQSALACSGRLAKFLATLIERSPHCP